MNFLLIDENIGIVLLIFYFLILTYVVIIENTQKQIEKRKSL